MSEWQSMETAPRDGSIILLANPYRTVAASYRKDAEWPWVVFDGTDTPDGWNDRGLMGWMPIPKAPHE